jgi:TldD protein
VHGRVRYGSDRPKGEIALNDDLKQAVRHTLTQGASYADAKGYLLRTLRVNLAGAPTYGLERGVSVRALKGGCWGSAGQSAWSPDALRECAERAVRDAKAGALLSGQRAALAPLGDATQGERRWATAVGQDPWGVPLKVLRDSLGFIQEQVKKLDDALSVEASLWVWTRELAMCSSDGHDQTQSWTGCGVAFEVTTTEAGAVWRRRYGPRLVTGGWDALLERNPFTEGFAVAQELLTLYAAPGPLKAEVQDVVLGPRAMAAVVHETLGHGLEADRVLRGEGLVGASAWKGAKIGGEWLRVEADATTPGGLGTWGFDEEGEPGQRWALVEAGEVRALITDREAAAALAEGASRGCGRIGRAQGRVGVRMPNVHLGVGAQPLSDLLRAAHGGLYVDGVERCEVDYGRGEVTLYGEIGRRIDGDYLMHGWASPVVSVPLAEVWRRCEGVADGASAEVVSVGGCAAGGGQWPWSGSSHQVSPGLFRGLSVWPGA